MFHIANTPRIYERLHAELVSGLPDKSKLDLYTLELMPYLKACITEAVRLTYGLSARNPRTRKMGFKYGEWYIPARTNVSMSIPDLSHDEAIFPDSKEFRPERWLAERSEDDGSNSKDLERYMVSFGRGTRSCLGINLAWTELYLTLGMLFRRFKFELLDPDVREVRMAHDFFIPVTPLEGKGVRVFVEGVEG